ncbi:GNAT family N-acetyltransferase [Kutzneria buriramensis]|uniref:RimJ/RimL family protein N-acetyltransferase n=1 Tax=Kutzneria buriramensis TaxID=1045776 RepID=A0A3E0H2Q3_9PSEU|nr:GNAT family protein [Kutzneria buriramensis]REH37071.1 RimJ/RimL family protein N-acetyltransferase [Kutzneria buriramensis]
MLADHFPLLGLRLRTPRLELRLPSSEELGELADLAVEGIHDADVTPFPTAWALQSPGEVALRVLQDHWQSLAAWSPRDWTLRLAVFLDGVVVGQQRISGRDFAITRQVETGSWLGKRYQGRGIGTEMRTAVLHLAFAGLDAEEAVSLTFAGVDASMAVSRKLGYEPNGVDRYVIDGKLTMDYRMRLTREAWRQAPVTIDGLDGCRTLLGL